MLSTIFGSASAEHVLLYLQCYEQGHASDIARTFGISVSQARKQLVKFELGGVLVSRVVGSARLYTWNPRFLLAGELRTLLQAAIDRQPPDVLQARFRQRRRPRRSGKPL